MHVLEIMMFVLVQPGEAPYAAIHPVPPTTNSAACPGKPVHGNGAIPTTTGPRATTANRTKTAWCGRQIARGKRRRAWPRFRRGSCDGRVVVCFLRAPEPATGTTAVIPQHLDGAVYSLRHRSAAGLDGCRAPVCIFPRRHADRANDACPWNLAS